MSVRPVFLAGLFLASCGADHGFAQTKPPTSEEVLAYLGFDAGARRDLIAGKIISKGFKEGTDKELAVTVAMVVSRPLADVFETARAGKTFQVDRDVIAFKDLGGQELKAEDFQGVKFSAEEAGEGRELQKAAAGSSFNLSSAEMEFLRTAAAQDAAVAYRRLLLDRCREYRAKGLAGIAPYSRGGKEQARPGEELRLAAQSAKLLAERFPAFHRVLVNYPRDDSKEFEHRFYWIKQRVEKRPCFILAHRVFYPRPDGCLIAERQFYVGHSYNSLQIVVGCLPVGDRTMLFYTNRTSTDQVAGFSSGLKHTMGRNMMRDEIVKWFEEIRKGPAGPKS